MDSHKNAKLPLVTIDETMRFNKNMCLIEMRKYNYDS